MSDHTSKPLRQALLFGVIVVVLYSLLFIYSEQLQDFAYRTRKGEKILFLIPVMIAFVFSWAHGAFTGHFWEVVGLRAAQRTTNK